MRAVAVVGGVLRLLDEGGSSVIEGPTAVATVAPHPRGVVALDVEGRVHVVDVDGGA